MSTIQPFLNQHLREKLANRGWLVKCLFDKEIEAFPYRPNPKGKAILSSTFQPRNQGSFTFEERTSENPQFLINIPVGVLPTLQHDPQIVQNLFDQIRSEGFGTTSAQSKRLAKRRIAVVLGINQFRSIDPALNRSFRRFISSLNNTSRMASKIIAFFVEPQWKSLKPKIFDIKKSFLILKHLKPKRAEKIRKAFESSTSLHPDLRDQIPYTKIRATIKDTGVTTELASQMIEAAPNAPLYFTLMDADLISLKNDEDLGAFSRLEKVIVENNNASIVSLGYSLNDRAPILLRLAVRIDMEVRKTMPSPYFPEPLSVFRVDTAEQIRSVLSFGKRNNLESRGLIESGARIFTGARIFEPDGGVITSTPSRMITQYMSEIEEITPSILRQKKTLQALNSNRIQSHAFPKQWSDILYASLPFSCHPVTKATTPMRQIFGVFNPISRMYAKRAPYRERYFDEVMNSYNDLLTQTQKEVLKDARTALKAIGMDRNLIQTVVNTARSSGKAIFRTLQDIDHRITAAANRE